jgi:hypothetical protein
MTRFFAVLCCACALLVTPASAQSLEGVISINVTVTMEERHLQAD